MLGSTADRGEQQGRSFQPGPARCIPSPSPRRRSRTRGGGARVGAHRAGPGRHGRFVARPIVGDPTPRDTGHARAFPGAGPRKRAPGAGPGSGVVKATGGGSRRH